MSDGMPQTLRANRKAEGLQLVRVGVGRWCGPGHGSDHTWQAQAGQIAGGESRGNPCVLGRGEERCGGRKSLPWRARVVILEVCVGAQSPCCQFTQIPHLLSWLILVTALFDTLRPFLGAIFHLEVPLEISSVVFCWARASPWAFPGFVSAGTAVTGVSSRSLWCVQSVREPLGAGDS